MSVISPPPVPVGPKREAPRTDTLMHNQGRVHSRLTQAEARDAFHKWKGCPTIQMGEIVFYTPHKGGSEIPAVINGCSNKTYSMWLMARSGLEEKTSVSWYDRTRQDAAEACDPKAAFNNNGTFRRSPFAESVAELISLLTTEDGESVKEVMQLAKSIKEIAADVATLKKFQIDTASLLEEINKTKAKK